MNLTVFIRKHKLYSLALIFDILAAAAGFLAAGTSYFADAYSHTIYRSGSFIISNITGLIPFSLVELLLYFLIIFIPGDLVFQIICGLKHNPGRKSLSGNTGSVFPAAGTLFTRLMVFFGHLFLVLSLLFSLYVFNCGINYHRSSFSSEAGLSSVSPELNEETLTALCEYLVDNINESASGLLSAKTGTLSGPNVSDAASSHSEELEKSEDKFSRDPACSGLDVSHSATYSPDSDVAPDSSSANTSFDAAVSSVRLYNGAILGETASSESPSLSFLWNTGRTAQAAMEKIGTRFSRLSGHYPFPKPLINSWILSIQQVTGVYSPFTIEANYNRDIPCYDIPFTQCHELSHLRGYMQEEEANFIAILATIGSDDTYFNYSGYVSAWVYAGNALAKVNPDKFAELYSRLNSYTLKDLRYNNEFWDQYETEIAETHEKLNDAYLKFNGQTSGVLSYGHVVDLMVVYFGENGSLSYL